MYTHPTNYYFYFIILLTIILSNAGNIFGKHTPYWEKDSPFECGYHSFRGQNRKEFNITFFIFGLLFLLFDLEILLVFPYAVSGYNNSYYGLAYLIVFLLILAAGFVFEYGKGALAIESNQSTYRQVDGQKKSWNTNILINFIKRSSLYLILIAIYLLVTFIPIIILDSEIPKDFFSPGTPFWTLFMFGYI